MKRFFLAAIVVVALVVASCGKDDVITPCVGVEPAAEQDSILAFIAKNGYTATKMSNGMYYQIVNQGVGKAPTPTSTVRANYSGKLFDGTEFDFNQTVSGAQFSLASVIQGWTIGVPLIQAGGTIRLFIPSKYAYGCTGSGSSIPANKPLFFEIKLLAVL